MDLASINLYKLDVDYEELRKELGKIISIYDLIKKIKQKGKSLDDLRICVKTLYDMSEFKIDTLIELVNFANSKKLDDESLITKTEIELDKIIDKIHKNRFELKKGQVIYEYYSIKNSRTSWFNKKINEKDLFDEYSKRLNIIEEEYKNIDKSFYKSFYKDVFNSENIEENDY